MIAGVGAQEQELRKQADQFDLDNLHLVDTTRDDRTALFQ